VPIFCRLFGHKPSSQVQLNPSTFVEHGYCKRCRTRLVRGGETSGWRELTDTDKLGE
jgi:hypothetical protein